MAAWFAVAAITLFHVCAVVGTSLRIGRLAVVPTYDDVAYLVDGLLRLKAFDTGGLRGLLGTLSTMPAHSPLTSMTATLGLAITPGQAVGTYALGGLWVVFFLVLGAILLRNLSPLIIAGLLLALLAVPAMASVISEFRPDMSWGLVTGFTGMFLVLTDFRTARISTCLWVGLLVGLNLIGKPTGFLPVLAVLGLCYAFSFAATLYDSRADYLRLFSGTLTVLFGTIIVAGPYYIISAAQIIAYVKSVMVQDTDIWMVGDSPSNHLMFYLRLAYLALGYLWPSFLVLFGIHALSIAFTRKFDSDIIRVVGVFAFIAACYTILTLAPAQSVYFGYFFYGPIIVASLSSAGYVLNMAKVPPACAFFAGLTVFMLFWTPDPGYFPAKDPAIVATDEANRAIIPSIQSALASADPGKTPVILNISPGPVALDIVHYYALLKGLPGIYGGVFRFKDWDELYAQIQAADIDVVSETGALGQSPANFPIYPFQARVIDMLKGDARWHAIACYKDVSGFRTYAFSRGTHLVQPPESGDPVKSNRGNC